jgi:trigger factor
MQVSVENTGGLERRLTVQVPGEEIQKKVDSKLQEISKQVRIKGFRPGRVPMSVVKQRYGKQVREDIVNETVQSSLQQAIQDENLRPATMPRVDKIPEGIAGDDLEFSAVVEIYPDMETLDVGDIEIARPDAEVTDQDIEEMLATLQEQRRTWEPVDRTPGSGDQVLIEYVAETKQGRVPVDGKQRLAIIMGQSGFDALEKVVRDMTPGAEKDTKLSFPENYREPALAGIKAKLALEVVSVSEGDLPEVDEAFIQSFGITEGGIEKLRDEIRENLQRELNQAVSSILKVQLIDKLVKAMPDLQVPESIVREEAASLAAQDAVAQGTEPDPESAEAFIEQATGRVRGGLLMGELAQQNSIRIDGAKVRAAIDTIANTYEQQEDVVNMYYSNPKLLQQVESAVLEEQVVDWVLEHAKVTPQEMKFQEVIASASFAAQSVKWQGRQEAS